MRRSFLMRIAGERKLPGGRVTTLALALALVACGGPPATSAASPAAATQPEAASSPAQPAIPTLGGPAASGIVLPTYFVTILESRYGLLSVVTTPGSVCTAEAAMPNGGAVAEVRAPRTADAGGRLSFSYPAAPASPGVGVHTVTCELAGQREQARARFDVK